MKKNDEKRKDTYNGVKKKFIRSDTYKGVIQMKKCSCGWYWLVEEIKHGVELKDLYAQCTEFLVRFHKEIH